MTARSAHRTELPSEAITPRRLAAYGRFAGLSRKGRGFKRGARLRRGYHIYPC